MEPLFTRFNRGPSKGKAKDSMDAADTVVSPPLASCFQRENLPERPLPVELPQRSTGSPTSIASFKPLPELSSRPLPPVRDFDIESPHVDQFLAERSPHETVNGNITTTNGSTGVLGRATRAMDPLSTRFNRGPSKGKAKDSMDTADTVLSPPSASGFQRENFLGWPPSIELPQRSTGSPTSSTASFEALSESEISSLFLQPTGDTYTTHSGVPLSDVAVEESTNTTALALEIALPHVDQVSPEQSSRETGDENISTTKGRKGVLKKSSSISPPPSSTLSTDKATTRRPKRPPSPHPSKLSGQSGRSNGVYMPPTWSEGAEEDLVTHLVPRERTRQEVLWEIVTSEEK